MEINLEDLENRINNSPTKKELSDISKELFIYVMYEEDVNKQNSAYELGKDIFSDVQLEDITKYKQNL